MKTVDVRKSLLSLKSQIDSCLKAIDPQSEKAEIIEKRYNDLSKSINENISESNHEKISKMSKDLVAMIKTSKGDLDALDRIDTFHKIILGSFATLTTLVESISLSVNVYASTKRRYGVDSPAELMLSMFSVALSIIIMRETIKNGSNQSTPIGKFIRWMSVQMKSFFDSVKNDLSFDALIAFVKYFIGGIVKFTMAMGELFFTDRVFRFCCVGFLVALIKVYIEYRQKPTY